MRCICCNVELSDYEATIRSRSTREYLDTCGSCLREAGITNFLDRKDLCPTQMIDEEDIINYEE